MHTFKVFLSICLTVSIFLYKTTEGKGPQVFCQLQWAPGSEGTVPKGAIECTEGIGEYIVRVNFNGAWVAGRLITNEGRAVIASPDDGSIQEFRSYQVLVGQPHCDLSWIDLEDNRPSPTHHPVDGDPQDPATTLFIVRGDSRSQTYCGTFDTDDSRMYLPVGPDDMNPLPSPYWLPRREIQILKSVYPPLLASVSGIRLDLTSINDAATRKELIGQERVQIGPGNPNPGYVYEQDISHSKYVQESIKIREQNSWDGLTKVDITVPPIFGSPIKDEAVKVFHPTDRNAGSLALERSTLASISTHYSIPRSQNASLSWQICSVAHMIENQDIPFEGDIVYKTRNSRLSGEQVQYVLGILGRPIGVVDDEEGMTVLEKVSGTLSGLIFLNVAINFDIYNSTSAPLIRICSNYYP